MSTKYHKHEVIQLAQIRKACLSFCTFCQFSKRPRGVVILRRRHQQKAISKGGRGTKRGLIYSVHSEAVSVSIMLHAS